MTCYSIEPLVHTVKGEGGVYISLFCKLVNEGRKGVKNHQNSVNVVYGRRTSPSMSK